MTMIETSGRTAGPDRQTGPDRQAAGPDRQAASPKTGRLSAIAARFRPAPDRSGPGGRHAAGRQTGPDRTAPDQTGPAQRPAGLPAQTAGPAAPGTVNGPQSDLDRWATEQTGPTPGPVRRTASGSDRTAGQTGPTIITGADRTAGPDRTASDRRTAGPDRVGPDRQTGPVRQSAGPDRPARTGPSRPRTAGPDRRTGPDRTAEQTPREKLDNLTADRGLWAKVGLRSLLVLIAVSLVFVVIAPPTLSAKDIIEWAQTNTPQAGLGLRHRWALFTFGALDMAAAVCVLVVLYCALVGARAGVFRIYVWVFAGASAFANYSQGTIPGSAGDKWWFFPLMSVIGPALLESVMHLVRHWVREVNEGARKPRPVFPLVDWLPISGSPQETFGAWRVGGALGIANPDNSLWAYRALTSDRGWIRRWWVRSAIRKHQRAAMAGAGPVYLPKLLPPDSLFNGLVDRAADELDRTDEMGWADEQAAGPDRTADEQAGGPDRTDRTAETVRATAPVQPAAPTGADRQAAGPDRTDRTAESDRSTGPLGNVTTTAQFSAVNDQTAGPDRQTAGPDRMDRTAAQSPGPDRTNNTVPIAHGAELILEGLTKIRDTFAGDYDSWDAFKAAYGTKQLPQNEVARKCGMGKDRINKKLIPHASEQALPWEAGQTAQPDKLAAAASN